MQRIINSIVAGVLLAQLILRLPVWLNTGTNAETGFFASLRDKLLAAMPFKSADGMAQGLSLAGVFSVAIWLVLRLKKD